MTTYNFPTCVKGDTFKSRKLKILVNNNTTFLNLTGCQILMQFKLNVNSNTIFEFKTSDSSILITDAINGEFQMISKILDFLPSTYIYDTQITFPDGTIKTYFKGSLKIEADVSRNS